MTDYIRIERRELRELLDELHRLHLAVSKQRAQLERNKKGVPHTPRARAKARAAQKGNKQ